MNIPIAVVGMSGIFPAAPDPDIFWSNIIGRLNACIPVPGDRWIVDPSDVFHSSWMPDKAVSKRACLIEPFQFDPTGIDIDPQLSTALDPLYHLVLHTGRATLADCRTMDRIDRNRMGVSLAAIALPTDTTSRITRDIFETSFEQRLFSMNHFQAKTRRFSSIDYFASRATSLPAAILARGFGLKGGSYTLDAACASSIYAVKFACDMLTAGHADAMLAGGVSRPECLYTQIGFSQLRALSPSGRCAPFDETADGLVVGEGAGMFVLKRLEDAVRDGDDIYGVIRGIGLSNDMRGNLLAPETKGQVRAMKSAYAAAGWSPFDIDLIECHGAGTPVGDAVELNSLRTLWGSSGWQKAQCAIGSVKSNIGHLLTAAGAAGMIKTLLAIKHRSLPPSANFTKASLQSPLNNGPFRVQTRRETWERRGECQPLKAAVSAFGFGGINGHILFQEYLPDAEQDGDAPPRKLDIPQRQTRPDIAIIGMASAFGTMKHLDAFEVVIRRGRSIIDLRPADRWKGTDETVYAALDGCGSHGAYMKSLSLTVGEFQIPPKEIPDILPQQLLMLKTAAAAMADAGLQMRTPRPAMGAIIGIDFDIEASDFQLRWHLPRRAEQWENEYDIDRHDWGQTIERLKDEYGPALTSARTLGALGGIVASRVAREFKFGGPSFIVSGESTSGLKAIDIAARLLRQGEVDTVLAGAVDLAGDIRSVLSLHQIRPISGGNRVQPFHPDSDGILPADGAAALILKRVEDAVKDGDRVYAVIKGLGAASDGGIQPAFPSERAYVQSLGKAVENAGIQPDAIGYIEAHGSGDPHEDNIERNSLNRFFVDSQAPRFIGSVKANIGSPGAASGMASIVKTALCLYHKMIPPMGSPADRTARMETGIEGFHPERFVFPCELQPWDVKTPDNSRLACVCAMTADGNCSHAVLQEPDAGCRMVKTQQHHDTGKAVPGKIITVPIGGRPPDPKFPESIIEKIKHKTRQRKNVSMETKKQGVPVGDYFKPFDENIKAVCDAHLSYLELSGNLYQDIARTVDLQRQAFQNGKTQDTAHTVGQQRSDFQKQTSDEAVFKVHEQPVPADPEPAVPAFSREMCMEFAIGSIEKVLGPDFAVVDTYDVRVRLPDEPLMLVDRILSVEGEKGSLGSGRVVTEHDVLPGAWYLDGDRAPVCISVEAGQADLFLCSYLGIDLAVKGERAYRLLDASVKFHRGLPTPGDTIRYEIEIEKFVRQGSTYLFFFNFEGTIKGEPLITMTGGCAGFFTEQEMINSGGIVLTEKDRQPEKGRVFGDFQPLLSFHDLAIEDEKLDALRRGDLETAFGPSFSGIKLSQSLRLPGGRMKLIDRILTMDTSGGRYGLGIVRAEADIHPDDWFLTCHFMDDMVMPGTLMYECCAHTLRVFLQRIGWVTDKPGVCYEPILERTAVLKCRGPVTQKTKHVVYEVEIREIGFDPEPCVVADAHMYGDGRQIVMFQDMSMKMTGVIRAEIIRRWQHPERQALYTRDQIIAFAVGKPSEAFGKKYLPFDSDRFIARLPGPPFSFLDRVVSVEPEPWVIKPDGWVEAEYDIRPDDWYFRADRSGIMPFAIILEIALQLCGWLAAYVGSALKSQNALHFRNLGGTGTLATDIFPTRQTLTIRSRMTRASEAADMIIENFDFQVLSRQQMIYRGDTYFGFFSKQALAEQVGIRNPDKVIYRPSRQEMKACRRALLDKLPPVTPDDTHEIPFKGLVMPAQSVLMIDEIETYIPDGGPLGLGFIRGIKTIDPEEWFFKAHFYQDPVWPGSLGIEAFIQLLRFIATDRWKADAAGFRYSLVTGASHQWSYRGQVLQKNNKVEVEAVITGIEDQPVRMIRANGVLKVDGLCIYHMKDFGIKLVALT